MGNPVAGCLWAGVCCLALFAAPALAQDAAAWQKDVEDAKTAYLQKDYPRCEQLLRAALDEARKFGPDDPRVGVTWHNQANLAAARGKTAEAEALYRHALELLERVRGADHPQTATARLGLADFLTAQRHFPEAEEAYRRTLTSFESAVGSNHPIVATVLERYALMLREAGRPAEAEVLEARARAIRARQADARR